MIEKTLAAAFIAANIWGGFNGYNFVQDNASRATNVTAYGQDSLQKGRILFSAFMGGMAPVIGQESRDPAGRIPPADQVTSLVKLATTGFGGIIGGTVYAVQQQVQSANPA